MPTFSFLFIIAAPKCERCLDASYTLICTRQTLMNASGMNVAWLGELAHAYWTMSKVRGTWLIILYCNWEESIPLFAGVEQAERHFNLHSSTPWDEFYLRLVGWFVRKRWSRPKNTDDTVCDVLGVYPLNWYLHSCVQAASTSEVNRWCQRKASACSLCWTGLNAADLWFRLPPHKPDRIIWKLSLLCTEKPCQRLKRCIWLLLPEEAFCPSPFLKKWQ